MVGIKISSLDTGVPLSTDETPATDTQDTSSAPTGTTKKYIRSDVLNWFIKSLGGVTVPAVRVATTAALTATYNNGAAGVGATLTNSGALAALSIDSVALALTNRVLVKNQAAPAQNGVYVVTTIGTGAVAWVLTRATDYDQAAEVIEYQFIPVNEGAVNENLTFQETGAGPFTIGTTAISFALSASLSGPSVITITGTANQIIASTPTGNVTLSLPQSIATTSSPTFANLILTNPLPVASGGTAVNALPTVAAASAFAAWNSSSNLPFNNSLPGFTTTVSAAGNTVLTGFSTYFQFLTGVTTQTFTMPVTSTLSLGQSFYVVNNSTGVLTVNSSGGNIISALAPDTSALFTCQLTSGTTAASWNTSYGEIITPVVVSQGGTGRTTSAAYAPIVGGTTSTAAQQSSTLGASGTLYRSAGASAVPVFTTATYPAATTINQILYSSANNVISALATGNNGILVTSAGGVPSIGNTVGAGLTMPSITFNTTTGIVGTTTNNNAAAGSVGEFLSSTVALGSGVNLSNTTAADITTLSLTAGDWDIWGNVGFLFSGANTVSIAWVSTASAILPLPATRFAVSVTNAGTVAQGIGVTPTRISVSGTTTVYISARATFSTGTCEGYGTFSARRVR